MGVFDKTIAVVGMLGDKDIAGAGGFAREDRCLVARRAGCATRRIRRDVMVSWRKPIWAATSSVLLRRSRPLRMPSSTPGKMIESRLWVVLHGGSRVAEIKIGPAPTIPFIPQNRIFFQIAMADSSDAHLQLKNGPGAAWLVPRSGWPCCHRVADGHGFGAEAAGSGSRLGALIDKTPFNPKLVEPSVAPAVSAKSDDEDELESRARSAACSSQTGSQGD